MFDRYIVRSGSQSHYHNHKITEQRAPTDDSVKLLMEMEDKAKSNLIDHFKVSRFYPSSKTCRDCGWINQDLKLSDREWTCNVIHDRDVNASRNILEEGLKIHRQGLAITKVERKSDVSNNAHSMKPEAQPSAMPWMGSSLILKSIKQEKI